MDAIYAQAEADGSIGMGEDLPCWLRTGFDWEAQVRESPTTSLSRVHLLAMKLGVAWENVAYMQRPMHRMMVRIEMALGMDTVPHPDHRHSLQLGRRIALAEVELERQG